MKKQLALALSIYSVAMSSVSASPSIDSLASCVAENTTGKERKDMARWVYVGMSSHPEIQSLSNVTDEHRVELDKKIADIFTKLITDSCPKQAKKVIEQDGVVGFQSAFGTIGQLAMQELMTNPNVNASFTNYTKYIDQNKFKSTFEK